MASCREPVPNSYSPFRHLPFCDNHKKDDLFYRQTEDYTVVATKPLDDQIWQPVPFTTLMAFKDGITVFTGTNHGKEFIETEEHLRILGFR